MIQNDGLYTKMMNVKHCVSLMFFDGFYDVFNKISAFLMYFDSKWKLKQKYNQCIFNVFLSVEPSSGWAYELRKLYNVIHNENVLFYCSFCVVFIYKKWGENGS